MPVVSVVKAMPESRTLSSAEEIKVPALSIILVNVPPASIILIAAPTESSASELSKTMNASSPSVEARLSRYIPYWAVAPDVVSEAVKLRTKPFSLVASV